MLDKKGRLFGKISIVDILVVVIVFVMLCGAFFAYQKISNKAVLTEDKSLVQTSQAEMLEVTMRLKEVRHMTIDAISVGHEIYAKDTGKYLGEITEVTLEPSFRLIYDTDGSPVMAEVPERQDVLIKVHIPGSRLENGYYTANNVRLVHGTGLEIKTANIQTTPVIENITIVSGE